MLLLPSGFLCQGIDSFAPLIAKKLGAKKENLGCQRGCHELCQQLPVTTSGYKCACRLLKEL